MRRRGPLCGLRRLGGMELRIRRLGQCRVRGLWKPASAVLGLRVLPGLGGYVNGCAYVLPAPRRLVRCAIATVCYGTMRIPSGPLQRNARYGRAPRRVCALGGVAVTISHVEPADIAQRREIFDERVARIDDIVPGYFDTWQLWRARLLGVGGIEVVPPLDPELLLVALITQSVVLLGQDAIFEAGAPSRCHENVATLLERGRTDGGATVSEGCYGYALSEDGLWRPHSWAVDSTGRVIETTVPRQCYVGIVQSRTV